MKLLKNAFTAWIDDYTSLHSAALAYYTIFSIAPLLIISMAIAGFVFGPEATQGQISGAVQSLLGANGAQAVEAMVKSATQNPKTGVLATIVGVITLLIGASGVFQQLQQSLNSIWKVQSRPGRTLWNLVRQRLLTFSMVIVIGFILMVSLVVTAAVTALGNYLQGRLPGGEILWQGINFLISFGIVGLLFACLFKILPDVQLSWHDVSIGAAVTAFLFDIGKLLIGLYLGQSSFGSTYGAAGSLVVILVWVFYAGAILLLGAQFTRAYATREGRKVLPKAGAEFISVPQKIAA